MAAKLFRSQRLISQLTPCNFIVAKLAFSLVWLASNVYNFFILNSDLRTIWSVGFLTSEASKKHIVCIKWTLGSAPKVSNSLCPLEFFMSDFSLCFHPCIHDFSMAKDYKASNLMFFMSMSFQFLCHGFHRALLNLVLLWWSNYYKKHQNLHNLIRNDCKGT